MVSTWSASNDISLGQVKVDEKSNEITAVPLLIHALELDDCIVTIDVIGCQKKTIVATGEHIQETRYCITSLDNVNPEEIATAIRQHWSIESNLHWQLDVTFRVDCSKKIQNAPRNFSAVTKIALSVLKNDKITKGSMNLKRLKAGWDEDYLARLLQDSAF